MNNIAVKAQPETYNIRKYKAILYVIITILRQFALLASDSLLATLLTGVYTFFA
jgi:hypothetical protein